MKTERGTSLVEMLVCCALVGIVLSLVYSMVVAGKNYLAVMSAKHTLQQEALQSITWISREISESDAECFQVATMLVNGVDGVVFSSPRSPVSGNVEYDIVGRMLWQQHICYYLRTINGVSTLCRKSRTLSPAFSYPPPAPPVDTVSSDASLPERVIARHVEIFSVSNEEVPEIKIRCRLTGFSRDYAIEVKTRLFLRN